jgi:hypothetical protein
MSRGDKVRADQLRNAHFGAKLGTRFRVPTRGISDPLVAAWLRGSTPRASHDVACLVALKRQAAPAFAGGLEPNDATGAIAPVAS